MFANYSRNIFNCMLYIDLKFNISAQLFYHNFSISCYTIRLRVVPIPSTITMIIVIVIRVVPGWADNGVIEAGIPGTNVKIGADCLVSNRLNFIQSYLFHVLYLTITNDIDMIKNQLSTICSRILNTLSLVSPLDKAALALSKSSLSLVLALFNCLYISLSMDCILLILISS